MARNSRNATRTTTTPAVIAIAAGFLYALSAPAAAEPNPLAGPPVNARDGGGVLGARNIDGTMRRPDVPIAEAALATVDLDASVRAKVDALLAERAKQIDAIVKANMQTLNTMKTDRQANAGAANERESRREHARMIMDMFKPVLEKGPLENQVAALMPEASRVTYLSQIEEHRELMIAERRAKGPRGGENGENRRGAGRPGRGGPPPGADDEPMLFEDPMLEMLDDAPPPPPPGRAQRGQRDGQREGDGPRNGRRANGPEGANPREMMAQLQSLQFEIRRSVERITGEREARTEDFVARLGLDAQQEGKVRDLLQQARQASRESDDPRAARREIMQELAAILTPEQQAQLRESMGRGQRRGGADRRPRRGPEPSDD